MNSPYILTFLGPFVNNYYYRCLQSIWWFIFNFSSLCDSHPHTHTRICCFFFWLCFLSKVINYVFGFFYCYVFNIVEENEIDDYDSDDHLRSSWWWWQNIYEFPCYAMYIMQINIRIFPSRSFFCWHIFMWIFFLYVRVDGWMNESTNVFWSIFSLSISFCLYDR